MPAVYASVTQGNLRWKLHCVSSEALKIRAGESIWFLYWPQSSSVQEVRTCHVKSQRQSA